jgi:hypothetical protein
VTANFQFVNVTPIAQAQSRVEAGARFNTQSDTTDWVRFGIGDVQFQATGPVDAATLNLQRSTVDPGSGSPNTTQVATATGNPGTIGVAGSFSNGSPAWFRVANAATFGPANTVVARTLQDLAAAINGLQPDYYNFAASTPRVDLVAATYTATTLVLTARATGAGGNAITTTETLTNGAWGGATLAGGAPGVAATGTLTMSGAFVNNETITINGTVYTLKTTLTPAAGEVQIATTQMDVTLIGVRQTNGS